MGHPEEGVLGLSRLLAVGGLELAINASLEIANVGPARRAEQAHTALTLNFVDGDHALLEQFLGFARHDPDRIVKLRTV